MVAPVAGATPVVVAIPFVVAILLMAAIVCRSLILLVAARLIWAGLVRLRGGRACEQERQRHGAGEQMSHDDSPKERENALALTEQH